MKVRLNVSSFSGFRHGAGAGTARLGLPDRCAGSPAEFDIAVGTVDQANMAVVLMTSRESATLDCRVAFVNGPERPVPRHITLHPGKQEVVSQFFRRAINRVRITIDCE